MTIQEQKIRVLDEIATLRAMLLPLAAGAASSRTTPDDPFIVAEQVRVAALEMSTAVGDAEFKE